MVIRECVEFEGEKYYKDDYGYFIGRRTKGLKKLHRMVWESVYGEIPKGMVIHHKDHDKDNNKIENLECMEKGKHHSCHARKLVLIPSVRARLLNNLNSAEAIAKKIAFIRSPAGKEMMAKRDRNAKILDIVCEECKVVFQSKRSYARFCSEKCGKRNRGKEGGPDSIFVICAGCGISFRTNRFDIKKYHSYKCFNDFRTGKPNGRKAVPLEVTTNAAPK